MTGSHRIARASAIPDAINRINCRQCGIKLRKQNGELIFSFEQPICLPDIKRP
jgi:hypothetical protein